MFKLKIIPYNLFTKYKFTSFAEESQLARGLGGREVLYIIYNKRKAFTERYLLRSNFATLIYRKIRQRKRPQDVIWGYYIL